MSRTAGELQVPDPIWGLPHFQNWLQAQKAAGNRLDGFDPILEFYVANGKFLFCWAAKVNVYISAEDRNKTNEIVISRPDVSHVVCLYESAAETRVVLVKEFRSPAATPDGFILESPGGSSHRAEDPMITASEELWEETGIRINPGRLVPIGSRQLAGTFSSHKAHVYAVSITQQEFAEAKAKSGAMIVGDDDPSGERTYVETCTVSELLEVPRTDWSTLGMIYAAAKALGVNV